MGKGKIKKGTKNITNTEDRIEFLLEIYCRSFYIRVIKESKRARKEK
jgi:hypothetical protein